MKSADPPIQPRKFVLESRTNGLIALAQGKEVMLFESTKALLRSIVQSLENCDEPLWDDHLETSKQCLYELHQTARSSDRTYRKDSNPKFQQTAPPTEGALRAIPAMKLMAGAIRRQDRAAAIVAGKAAIVELDGPTRSRLPIPTAAALERVEQPAAQAIQPTKLAPTKLASRHPHSAALKRHAAGPKRTAAAKRRPKARAASCV